MKDKGALEKYFSLLKSTPEENDLINKPAKYTQYVSEFEVPFDNDYWSLYDLRKKGK